MERDKVFEIIINNFRNICDNKLTFVYPNITENKKGDIQRFFNRPIKERIAFLSDIYEYDDNGKHMIIITEKGIYDRFDCYMFAIGFGLHLGKSNSSSYDHFFSWEDINRVEFSEKKKDFYIYFDEGYDTFWRISRSDLLDSDSFTIEQCTNLANGLSYVASLFHNDSDRIDEVFSLEAEGNLKKAVEIIEEILSQHSNSEEMCFLKYVSGRMHLGYCGEIEDEIERMNLLEKAIDELKWALNHIDDDWRSYEESIHYFYGLALYCHDENRIARKHILLAMNSDSNNLVDEAKKLYSECEQEMTDFWDNYTENVDYHDRKYIMPVKLIEGCADMNIETFLLEKVPNCVQFPIGHPVANQLYIGHPYNPSLYVPFEESEDIFFVDKVHELCYLLECLGAEEINITSIKGKDVSVFNDSQVSYSGSADIKLFSGEASGGKQSHHQGEMTSNNQRTMRIKLDPMRKPFLPEGLIWYDEQPDWQRLVNSRINGNVVEWSESVSTSQTKFTSNQEKRDIKASAKYLWTKVHAEVEQNIETQFKETTETQWKVEVKFRSIKDFANVIDDTQQITTQDTKLISTAQMTDDEQSYAEEVKFCLEDGTIGDKERRFLERMRTKLGISPERAAEIEESLQKPQFTEEELEYLDAVKEEIVDGTIPDSSRRLLNRLRRSLDISEERAIDVERYALS